MQNVNVGDEVGYGRYGSWNGAVLSHGFARVAKINHWGHIVLDNGKTFDKHGRERNAKFGELHLMDANDLRERLRLEQEGRDRATAANELRKILDGQRNGFGEMCPVSNETRQLMIDLISKL